MGFMSKRTTSPSAAAAGEKDIPLAPTPAGKPVGKQLTPDEHSDASVRAYEADAAELEAAVAGTMAAGADADAVFGEISEGGPNYRAVGWKCEFCAFPKAYAAC